jgi:hypothetical protein
MTSSVEMNLLLTKINAIEEMMKFDNRKKKGIICGNIFGLSCTINHHHTNDNEKWNGNITNRMIAIVIEFKNISIYNDVYLKLINNTPNITPEIIKKILNDEEGLTTEMNITSIHKYMYDHVIDYHLMEKIKNHPSIEFVRTIACGEEIGFLINIKRKDEYYIDTLILDVYNEIKSILNIGSQYVKNINIWSDSLPSIFKYLVVALSNEGKQELNKKLAGLHEMNKKIICNIYNSDALDSEVFVLGMSENWPDFCPKE